MSDLAWFTDVGASGLPVGVNPQTVTYVRAASATNPHTIIHFAENHSIAVKDKPSDVGVALDRAMRA